MKHFLSIFDLNIMEGSELPSMFDYIPLQLLKAVQTSPRPHKYWADCWWVLRSS